MANYKAPFPQQGSGIGLTKPAPLPEREPTEDEQIVDRINYLRGGEGDSVTIFCDNPDFNGHPERVVECCGDWTGWEDRRYGGDTLLGALNAAWLDACNGGRPCNTGERSTALLPKRCLKPKRMRTPFPKSLPQFQKLFPDDAACARYLEKVRWPKEFICPVCKAQGEPYRFTARPRVLRCRACRQDTALTAGTVMERTRTPLTTWFWGAYLVSSMTPGLSAMQFQRQLGLSRYETAFQILHKLRAHYATHNLGFKPKDEAK